MNDERIPIWVADYVLMDYGTGAIMAVPAHDERDFAFAETFGLPIVQVVAPRSGEVDEGAAYVAHSEDEVLVNSGPFTRLSSPEAKQAIVAWLAERGLGRPDGQLPPARLAALAAALLGLPDPDRSTARPAAIVPGAGRPSCRCCCPRSTTTCRRGARRWRRPRTG